jgi:hypothetical protein
VEDGTDEVTPSVVLGYLCAKLGYGDRKEFIGELEEDKRSFVDGRK